ncbi:MAG TPA: lipocalin family protein, partial [Arenibacter sp.]|nr:lipocalin family protein [Arenibacter sp.]
VVLTLTACKGKVTQDHIPHLNGYWEIEKVTFPDGSEKKYTISTSIDYIEIQDQKGFRKKVQPNLSGTYDTSDDAEPFSLIEKKGFLPFPTKTN